MTACESAMRGCSNSGTCPQGWDANEAEAALAAVLADLDDARAALRVHVKDAFAALTDEERKEIMRGYCRRSCAATAGNA